ncbi:MAG TPA: GNAT family N-acetyltransferase [Acidimicrobiales bacterium]|nr:GNAT family N-acetyltransferase [Acidimicrobiales bacterium]
MEEARRQQPVVRTVTAADVPAVVDVLGRSFDDDPVSRFTFSGDLRRRRGLRSFFRAQIVHQYLPYHQVFTTDDLGGAAVWGPPNRPRQGYRELLQLLPTLPYIVGKHMMKTLQLLAAIDALHPKEPHWYLATLGTEPTRQGQGIGSALLASTLAQVDREGMPAYLESSKERNVPLYARYGFEVIDEFHGPGDAPTLWRMWREPRPPESDQSF